jgi:hypothetical protein
MSRVCFREIALCANYSRHSARQATARDSDWIAAANRSACKRPRISAKVRIWTIDKLDGKSKWLRLEVGFYINSFKLLENGGALLPRHLGAHGRDVVAETSGNRNCKG